jgi:hypothetical protein
MRLLRSNGASSPQNDGRHRLDGRPQRGQPVLGREMSSRNDCASRHEQRVVIIGYEVLVMTRCCSASPDGEQTPGCVNPSAARRARRRRALADYRAARSACLRLGVVGGDERWLTTVPPDGLAWR